MREDSEEEDDNEEETTIFTPKLELVLAAKSRKQQYTSSPVISHHVSLSLLSSPDDDSHSRASVPFSWEEEPGKPKHDLLLLPPSYSKCLDLPPRLFTPSELTKMPLTPTRHHCRPLAALKRWFPWRKEKLRGDSLIFPSEGGSDTKITRTRRFHNLSDVTRCYFWEVPQKNQKLKNMTFKAMYNA